MDGISRQGVDHLSRMFVESEETSEGSYTPERYDVYLRGADSQVDRIVYIHEMHHGALSDSTAWGCILHIYARLGSRFQRSFTDLMNACRLLQESYATYASVSAATATHDVDRVLAIYPTYANLFRDMDRLVACAAGPNRRFLLATALARVCMQGSVLDVFTEAGVHSFSLDDVRPIDQPDARWKRWLDESGTELPVIALAADERIGELWGGNVLDLDPDTETARLEAQDPKYDALWNSWEECCYDELATRLRNAGATVLTFNGHQDQLPGALAMARKEVPGLRLAAGSRMASTDRELAWAMTEDGRLWLTPQDQPWPAQLSHDNLSLICEQAIEHSQVLGEAVLFVDVRLPERLRDGYSFSSSDQSELLAMEAPVSAVRLIRDDKSGRGVITHRLLVDVAEVEQLAIAWSKRGPVILSVSAGCLIDKAWQDEWLSELRSLGRLVWLIDVELNRIVPSWVRGGVPLRMCGVNVNDKDGDRSAAVLSPDGTDEMWVIIGGEVTCRLLMQSLTGEKSLRTINTCDHVDQGVLTLDVAHILATEPFLDFRALEARLG